MWTYIVAGVANVVTKWHGADEDRIRTFWSTCLLLFVPGAEAFRLDAVPAFGPLRNAVDELRCIPPVLDPKHETPLPNGRLRCCT